MEQRELSWKLRETILIGPKSLRFVTIIIIIIIITVI